MSQIFNTIEKFFISLNNYLTFNWIMIGAVGLFLFTMICVIISTSCSYEVRLIKAIDMFNNYFMNNPQINEETLVPFNNRMKSNRVPKQLRKQWQQYVLYREEKASHYMSFENCVSNPIKNSTYKRDVKNLNIISYILAIISLVLNVFNCDSTVVYIVLQKVLLTPMIILVLNYLTTIFLNARHNAVVSDLNTNYQYFEVNIDKATETLPEYVDYEVLFDKNEIKRGIPILYAYLQKRAEEEKRELERARLKNIEHEQFEFDEMGVASSLVLDRAMQEAENYIAERKKFLQDIEQINSEITQEELNYRETTKEYQRQMQVSKESFNNFKQQLENASSTIEANYMKKQQQQELDRQRNLERDYDTATDRHKKIMETYQNELTTVENYIKQAKNTLEKGMMSEFNTYSNKVYDEALKVVEERESERLNKIKIKVKELEENIIAKDQEINNLYALNQQLSEQLKNLGATVDYEDVQPAVKAEPIQLDTEIEELFNDNYKKPNDNDDINDLVDETAPINEYNYDYAKELSDDSNTNYSDFDDIVNTVVSNQYSDQTSEVEPEISTMSEEESIVAKPNRGVGRPKKVVTDEPSTQPKRRGRPKKDDSDKGETISVGKLTKGPGRPKKVMEEPVASEPKKGRGRPKKVEVLSAEAVETRKGRGRPKKVVEETLKTEVKVGRGRPKKAEVQPDTKETKKGRGRPKKEETQPAETKEVKAGRGRPKKVVEETAKTEVKVGRGRPKKTEVQPDTKETKTGRGRPKKAETQTAETNEKVKAGRGRPKKIETPKAETSETKKSRGRPKKDTQVEEIKEVKAGRGRPKKVVENDMDIDAYLKEINAQIEEENAKLEKSKKELEQKSNIKKK